MTGVRSGGVVAVVVFSLVLSACGGGNSSDATAGMTGVATDPVPVAAGAPEVQSVDLTCDLGVTAQVSNTVGAPTDVLVIWSPLGTRGVDFASYIITLTSADGSIVRQAAKKLYAAGDSPTQFVYDLQSAQQTNIETTDEDLSRIDFPDALTGVTGQWKATGVVNVDGADKVICS